MIVLDALKTEIFEPKVMYQSFVNLNVHNIFVNGFITVCVFLRCP